MTAHADLRAAPGDRIVIHGRHPGEVLRDAEVLEVLGPDGAPPYVVRWEDTGHETRLYPGPDATVQHFEHHADGRRRRSA